MANSITLTVIPTGGIIRINLVSADVAGLWTLTRTATGTPVAEPPYTLYSGPALVMPNAAPEWLDYGDGLNQPLDPAITYQYTFSTESGSVTESAQPSCSIIIDYDDYTRLLVRILQAGVKSLVPPSGVSFNRKPVVTVSMPLTGTPPIPCISVNEDLLQQGETPIGHGMNTDTTNNEYQIFELVMRRYRVTVFTSTVDEREYWKFAIIALFKSVMIPVLEHMGQNVTTKFQCASSQVVDVSPGFYFADIGLEFTGDMPVRIKTNYGVFSLSPDFTVIEEPESPQLAPPL
jgi:hypothetical protein